MPKKLCCCKDDEPKRISHWVAIPCKEYLSHTYRRTPELQKFWPNVDTTTSALGLTYPYFVSAQGKQSNIYSFDNEREIYVMQRGGGGGGLGKGGNAAYIESIIPASPTDCTFIPAGGSGPSALDTHTNIPNFSGGLGYPSAGWGGGANSYGLLSQNQEFQTLFVSSGGGGTPNETDEIGGHGGIDTGVKGSGDYGGAGGNQSAGGTVFIFSIGDPTEPTPGKLYKGGNGRVPSGSIPVYPLGGGGGGAGYYGGGGGNFNSSGGGGSSKVQQPGNIYNLPGTTFGPGSRCNPYFSYKIVNGEAISDAGLGSNRVGRSIFSNNVWEPPILPAVVFLTGESGADGETAVYFRTKWCTCTEEQSQGKSVPFINYLCLTENVANIIIQELPTTEPPPDAGGKVLPSFVYQGERFLLLYQCDLSCEEEYVVTDEDVSDIKWYVEGVERGWFADFPQWSPDQITSCCDCYDCVPICPETEVKGSQRPKTVRSCAYQKGSTCYWHYDKEVTKWYFECKPTNCWADFGLDSVVKPYDVRVMDPNVIYDCDEDPCPGELIWTATKCDNIKQNICCQEDCCGPEQIKFCTPFLKQLIGEQNYPPDLTNKCYYFRYSGCIYVLSSFAEEDCIPENSTLQNPINQGSLFAITDKMGLECCRPGLFAQTDPEEDCEDIITEPYTYKDMFGVSQDVVITSKGSKSYKIVGPEPCSRVRANSGAEKTSYHLAEITTEEKFGLCIERRGIEVDTESLIVRNITPFIYTGDSGQATSVGGGIRRIPQKKVICDECLKLIGGHITTCDCEGVPCNQQTFDCCTGCELAPGGRNPNGTPISDFCSGGNPIYDPDKSHSIDTTYSVSVAGDDQENVAYGRDQQWFVDDVLELTFSLCSAEAAGIDINDPSKEQEIINFYKEKIMVVSNVDKNANKFFGDKLLTAENYPYTMPTPWPFEVQTGSRVSLTYIKICDYKIKCFSGNSAHIAAKINQKIGTVVQATPLNTNFWFGYRQNYSGCEESQRRPPYIMGDYLEIGGGSVSVENYNVKIKLIGTAQRFYCCSSQRVTETETGSAVGSLGGSNNYCISLNSVSPPEMQSGIKFDMIFVAQDEYKENICVPPGDGGNPTGELTEVVKIPVMNGYPQFDIYVFDENETPILVKKGYATLCTTAFRPNRDENIYELGDYEWLTCDQETECESIICSCLGGPDFLLGGQSCNVGDELKHIIKMELLKIN